jgi:uncharacterized LabA/DUF88 family protein
MYLYVDGENHYLRTEAALRAHRQDSALKLDTVFRKESYPHWRRYPIEPTEPNPVVRASCRFFWDVYMAEFVNELKPKDHVFDHGIDRAVFFSSVSGDDNELFQSKEFVRRWGFEPRILGELRDQRKRRDNVLKNERLMEKPKGVDLEMGARILADAFQGNYQRCALFTSDSDFLPVIRVVRQLGKTVTVCGYKDQLPDRAELLYEPDRFIDLGMFLNDYKPRGY